MAATPVTSLPAPAIDVMMPAAGKWACEYQAFLRLLPVLLKTHRGQFVAIHNRKVVASGQDKLAVALEVLRQIGNVPIHVGLVSEVGEAVVRTGVRRVVPSSGGAQ